MDAVKLAEAGFVELDGARGEFDGVFRLQVVIDLKKDAIGVQ